MKTQNLDLRMLIKIPFWSRRFESEGDTTESFSFLILNEFHLFT